MDKHSISGPCTGAERRKAHNTFLSGDDDAPGVVVKHRPISTSDIELYFERSPRSSDFPEWVKKPEVPSSAEIGMIVDGEVQSNLPPLKTNMRNGPFSSLGEYLETQYELLREDTVEPLRSAVAEVRDSPDILESQAEAALIYEGVYIMGLTPAPKNIAIRVEFSMRRAGKNIRWEQSQRLIAGSLVALTPSEDMFKSKCIVAVVAARPLANLVDEPFPQVDLYFRTPEDIEIDPLMSFVMVEARDGYFEANRHTLLALQKVFTQDFPLKENIVGMERSVLSSRRRVSKPVLDISHAVKEEGSKNFRVDVLRGFPKLADTDGETGGGIKSSLDATQLRALRRMLTKRLALVQGPPGTGKTFVSVMALRILLGDRIPGPRPPIIVSAHTNHALDQLLRHLEPYAPDFVRLGGRTTDREVIEPHTIYQLKMAHPPRKNDAVKGLFRERMRLTGMIKTALRPLIDSKPLTAELLLSHNIISQLQHDSIVEISSGWVGPTGNTNNLIDFWLGKEQLEQESRTQIAQDPNLDLEEADEHWRKQQVEEEGVEDRDEREMLRGEFLHFRKGLRAKTPSKLSISQVQALLYETHDLRTIPRQHRGSVYNYFRQLLQDQILGGIRNIAHNYDKFGRRYTIGTFVNNFRYLEDKTLIGVTTTGLSKYRAMLAALNPEVVLIEEAGETTEPYVVAGCFPSLDQLILVGDHKQLRPRIANPGLGGNPFFYDMSMFERLVRNKVEFTTMLCQRRMQPEFRQLLRSQYPKLHDHSSVHERPDVPGMGRTKLFFFNHEWPESVDENLSKINVREAEMISNFFKYLVQNGTKPEDITVLTFYNGQRKQIQKSLQSFPELQGKRMKVATVDSYQGEENHIIILALTRVNYMNEIGFVRVDNRVTVALSRAKSGFYLFGSTDMLETNGTFWGDVLDVLKSHSEAIGSSLHIVCQRHNNKVAIMDSADWADLSGGCHLPCRGSLPCGHCCTLKCHPFQEDQVQCEQPCAERVPACGHKCVELCSRPHRCGPCKLPSPPNPLPIRPASSTNSRGRDISRAAVVRQELGGGHPTATNADHNVAGRRAQNTALKNQQMAYLRRMEIEERNQRNAAALVSSSAPQPGTTDAVGAPEYRWELKEKKTGPDPANSARQQVVQTLSMVPAGKVVVEDYLLHKKEVPTKATAAGDAAPEASSPTEVPGGGRRVPQRSLLDDEMNPPADLELAEPIEAGELLIDLGR